MKPAKLLVRGFTLIELVIFSITVSIMAVVLSPIMLSSLSAYDSIQGDVVVLDKLRYATERMAREIREIQYASSYTTPATNCSDSPTTTDHYCIFIMGANSMRFRRSYTDSTGAITWRTVTIGNTGSAVTLAYSDMSSTGAIVLTDELGAAGNLGFAYFQQDGSTATLAGNVTCPVSNTCMDSIEITLTLSHNGNDYTQHTRVNLRNSIS
jgi:Tfp pilus assembly protein PilW